MCENALDELKSFHRSLKIAVSDTERYLGYLKQVLEDTKEWPPDPSLLLDLADSRDDAFNALGTAELLRSMWKEQPVAGGLKATCFTSDDGIQKQ